MSKNLEKAEQIAKDTQAKMDAKKKQAESTEAAKKPAESTEPAKKTEGKKEETIVEKAEQQAENDARILSADETTLSDEDKQRKVELVKAKEAKSKPEETAEDKEKRIKAETQKRIDEVISELKAEKAERNKDKEKIAELEARLEELVKPKKEEDKALLVKKAVAERIEKALIEDKDKPREEKREMSREELEEWLAEDYVAATEWLTDNRIRRRAERDQIEAEINDKPKKVAEEFVTKQQESLKKLLSKYPSLVPSKEKQSEFKGKTPKEINDILAKENPDYAMMLEIVRSDPVKYVESVNAPELVMEEMDRRKAAGNGKKTITLTEEELQERIKQAAVAEAQRIASLDEGITSTSGGKKTMEKGQKSELRLKQEDIARKAGISIETLDARIKEREKQGIRGTETASSYKEN